MNSQGLPHRAAARSRRRESRKATVKTNAAAGVVMAKFIKP